jgi:multicomponent Na+:H+ antiporter subunit E
MRIVRVSALVALWVALWGEVSVANIAFGTVVATGVTIAFPPLENVNGNRIRPIAMMHLLTTFSLALVRSTWAVVVAVLRPKRTLRPAIVAVPLRGDDPVITTLVANGISLTPGTLTVDLGPASEPGEGRVLYVHALTLGDIDDLIADTHDLEDRATAAFPPPTELDP